MLGHTTQPSSQPPSLQVATSLGAALALAAGALLYFSDHDNLDRHWRIALVMVLSATLLVLWPATKGEPS